MKKNRRKKIGIAILLIAGCLIAVCLLAGRLLAGRQSKDTPLRAYCNEAQQQLLDQVPDELPGKLVYNCNDNIKGRYETTDPAVISEILQALQETKVVSEASGGSTDSRILSFETADGETCLFWFNYDHFQGADGNYYTLSGYERIWELTKEIQESDPEYRDAMRL